MPLLLELYVFVARARADRRRRSSCASATSAQIWEVTASLLFFSAPIMYPITILPVWAQRLVELNPFVQVLQDVRADPARRATPPRTASSARIDNRLFPIAIAVALRRVGAASLPARVAALRGARMSVGPAIEVGRRLEDVLDPARAAGTAQGVLRAPAASASTYERNDALRDVTFCGRARASSSASSARTAAARARCSRCSPASTAPTRGTVRIGGRLSPFIELGVGFNPEFTARDEHRDQRDADRADAARGRGALRRDPRVRRARALRRPAAEELLVGDAAAPRLLDRDPGAVRHPPARRGARRRRRRLPGEVLPDVRGDAGRRQDGRLRQPRPRRQ